MPNIAIGKCYFRRTGLRATVRLVLDIKDDIVTCQYLWGPLYDKYHQKNPHMLVGTKRLPKFQNWATGDVRRTPDDNYEFLEGCKILKTYIVLSTEGKPIIRCGSKRADFYLKNNYAKKIDEDTLQFTTTQTENKLFELYGTLENEFFMSVKNDKCVVCGKPHNLTRHHIVPERHTANIPQHIKERLSNILFVCRLCHIEYEKHSVKEPNSNIKDYKQFIQAWEDHFIDTMKPKHMPDGWHVMVDKQITGLGHAASGPV